jgi:hypothetical protein
MSYNPFVLFNARILDRLVAAGVKHFVRQTYDRGRDPLDTTTKGAYLLSHYKDTTNAIDHFSAAIKFDTAKYLYNVAIDYDMDKLRIAASQPAGYKIYVDLFSFELSKWTPPESLAKKMEQYLRVSSWKAGDGKIATAITTQAGVIYITFRRGSDVMKVNLSEIEKA